MYATETFQPDGPSFILSEPDFSVNYSIVNVPVALLIIAATKQDLGIQYFRNYVFTVLG